jgi:ankyrin repeat protein
MTGLDQLEYVVREIESLNIKDNIKQNILNKYLYEICRESGRIDNDFLEEMVDKLVIMGADINYAHSYDRTPIWLAINNEDVGLVRILLRHAPNIYTFQDEKGYFAETENNREINEMVCFRAGGGDFGFEIEDEYTKFNYAILKNNIEDIKQCIKNGFNVNNNTLMYRGETLTLRTTLLHYAVWGQKIEIIKLMIKAGANAYKKNYWNKSPMDIAIYLKNKKIINLLKCNWNYKNNKNIYIKDRPKVISATLSLRKNNIPNEVIDNIFKYCK